MPRPIRQHVDSAGSDSFLDIVANIVGILIILVMMVGARLKNAPLTEAPPPDEAAIRAAAALETEIGTLESTAASLEEEVLGMAGQTKALERETQLRRAQRDRLALAAEARRRAMDQRRGALDANSQAALDQEQKAAAAQALLESIRGELEQLRLTKPESVKLVSYPTPISKTVHGEEVHFQLRGGRVAYVPLDELIQNLRSDSRQLVWQLRDVPEVTGTVGPTHGFRMRYTFARVNVGAPVGPRGSGRASISSSGSVAQLTEFTLVPTRAELGEPLKAALGPSSQLRSHLAGRDPQNTTVTLWVYPDSFGSFRELRKELFHLGYQIAGRPLPHGAPISGSPSGSRSSAQ